MLAEIRDGGEEVARSYAEKLDRYKGNIVLSEQEIQEAVDMIPEQVRMPRNIDIMKTCHHVFQDRASIDFSVEQVVKFATVTRAKSSDWEVDLGNGSTAGTK